MINEIKKLIKSFKFAGRGIKQGFQYERNFRIDVFAMLYVTFFGFIGDIGKTDFMFLFLCFAMMLSAELVNTAVERLSDQDNNTGYDKNVRDAKDIAAGAVLIGAIFCVFVGVLVFFDERVLNNIYSFFSQDVTYLLLLLLTMPISYYLVFLRKKK